MNISDFPERGNPDDMDDDFQDLFEPRKPKNEVKPANKPSGAGFLSRNATIVLILILCSAASFGLGMLAGGAGQGSSSSTGGLIVGSVPMTKPASSILSETQLDTSITGSSAASSTIPSGGEVVGDNSTHSFYLPWCTQVASISKANETWFASEDAAKSAGFSPGSGCPGL